MGLIKLVTPERIEIRDPAGLGRMAGPQEGLCAALLQMQAQENGAQGPSTCRASSFPAASWQPHNGLLWRCERRLLRPQMFSRQPRDILMGEVVPLKGLEPPTPSLRMTCSTS